MRLEIVRDVLCLDPLYIWLVMPLKSGPFITGKCFVWPMADLEGESGLVALEVGEVELVELVRLAVSQPAAAGGAAQTAAPRTCVLAARDRGGRVGGVVLAHSEFAAEALCAGREGERLIRGLVTDQQRKLCSCKSACASPALFVFDRIVRGRGLRGEQGDQLS